MRIADVHVDGFGVWSHLDLNDLSDRITVFYGPNEAGKTTLLEFLRTVLYGLTPERQARYLPPLGGGAAGGRLRIAVDRGRYEVHRQIERQGDRQGALVIRRVDGKTVDARLLDEALGGVDEATYRHLFAVGLEELQQLATLSDGEAARWLYELTTGLDRVSLSEVMHDLARSREQLLADDGRPSRLGELIERHRQVSAELDRAPTIAGKWSELAERAEGIERHIERLEGESQAMRQRLSWLDRAAALRQSWQLRAAIEAQLRRIAELPALPAGSVEQFDALLRRRKQYRGELEAVERQIAEGKRRLARLGRQRALWRQAPRIEALGEQLEWIVALEADIRECEQRLAELERQWESRRRQVEGGDAGAAAGLAESAARALPKLEARARAVRQARQQLAALEQQLAQRQQQLEAHAAPDDPAAQEDLPRAVEEAGQRVARLRRRLALDERLDEMRLHLQDLEEQGDALLDRQLMPLGVLAGLGAVFVLGVVLILIGLFFPTSMVGAFGRTLGLLGVLGTATAAAVKFLLERSHAKQLEHCQKQRDLLGRQIDETGRERDALDAELPQGGGPLAQRLQAAERELARLEAELPQTALRQHAASDLERARQQRDAARKQFDTARKAWKQALAAAGLPLDLTPRKLRELARHRESLDQLRSRCQQARHDLALRRRQYDGPARRIRQLAADVGLTSDGLSAAELLGRLEQLWSRQKPRIARSRKLRRRLKQLRRRRLLVARRLRRVVADLKQRLAQAGVARIAEYRHLAAEAARAERLRQEQEALTREIEAAIEAGGAGEELKALLAEQPHESVADRRQQAVAALEACQQQLKELAAQLGAIRHQRDHLAEDRRREEKFVELSAIEAELDEAVQQWQTQAVTWLLLDSVREQYQRTRQPETLVEASGYLRRLTSGRYHRVWTPLDEAVLYVDDADGQPLPVEALSRGTREQLFLSLRLALISLYARRGVRLPVILDDVLVNFDLQRARAAAELLRDFAQQGHQLLVFTCHRHVWEMFRAMEVETRVLPGRDGRGVDEVDVVDEVDEVDAVDAVDVVDAVDAVDTVDTVDVVDVADRAEEWLAAEVNADLAADGAVDPVEQMPVVVVETDAPGEEDHDPPPEPTGPPRVIGEDVFSEQWVRVGEIVRRREMLPEQPVLPRRKPARDHLRERRASAA